MATNKAKMTDSTKAAKARTVGNEQVADDETVKGPDPRYWRTETDDDGIERSIPVEE